MNSAIAIFVGGGLGSLLRYGVGRLTIGILPLSFPFGTFLSNMISCLILGIFLGISSLKPEEASPYRYLIAVGLCGGFSTFSAFSAETLELFRHGSYWYAIFNVTGNVITGLVAIAAGAWLTRSFFN